MANTTRNATPASVVTGVRESRNAVPVYIVADGDQEATDRDCVPVYVVASPGSALDTRDAIPIVIRTGGEPVRSRDALPVYIVSGSVTNGRVLLETGDFLLLESGDKTQLE